MAAPSTNWYEKLKVHPICSLLKETDVQKSESDGICDAKNLITVKNGELFVWNSSSVNIIHCNLKSLLSESEDVHSRFQVLVCTDTPRFDVDGLLLNPSGNHLAIWGPRGVRVIELPQRRGKFSQFEGGKDVITCKTVNICSRQLAGNQWLQIRKIDWHPGSSSGMHLAVLTSDNAFSVYSLLEPDRPITVMYIQPRGEGTATFTSPSKLNIMAALGETTVGFDFGIPQEMRAIQQLFQIPKDEDVLTVWPVFFVKGNGDIMVSYSEVISNRPLQLPLQGPLVMRPPSEDNYGVDACSVLCLETVPPVLVVGTCDGRLHHCIVLPHSDRNSERKEIQPAPGTPHYQLPGDPSLYVMETVELELFLADTRSQGNFDLQAQPFTCPIKLMKDPYSTDRYHCLHSAGIHSIALPWIHGIHTFLSSGSDNITLSEDQDSVVEHLICTKPLYSSPVAPVLGMDIVSDPTLVPTMLILSMDREFITLPMSNKYKVSWRDTTRNSLNIESPPKHTEMDSFTQRIARILQRSVSNPLLMTSAMADMGPQECYQLLIRVTQVLREEYIQKQEHARHELEDRVKFLQQQKEKQSTVLQELKEAKENVAEKAGQIAEHLESCHDEHAKLLGRLENIMRKLQSRVPVLSLAEKQMKAELKLLEEKVKEYSVNLSQLLKKQEYQQRRVGQPKTSSQQPSSIIKPQQLNNIKNILREEGEEIGQLMKQISQLKMETNS